MSFGIRLLRNSLLLTISVLIASCEQPGQGSADLKQESDKEFADSQELAIDEARLREFSASEIAPLLKSGVVTVEAYHRVLLDQAERHSDRLNAFITLEPESVLEAARKADERRANDESPGPLFGIPISLKDLIVTEGMPTTFGTKKFAGFISDKNAAVVDKLQEAGAIIFGKNNTQELAFGSNGYNSHYGQQLNPYDDTRIAGGSSGGGVAAVAARILPIAIGSDTAASIRVPAAYTGLYGLRPSTGRYDNSGVLPLSPTLDTIGPLTRSVDDMVLIDSVLTDDFSDLPEIDLKTLRLGVPKAFFHNGVSQEMMSVFNRFLSRLEAAGVTLVEVDLDRAGEFNDAGLYPILFSEVYPSITRFLKEWGDGSSIEELYAELGWDVKGMWDELVVPGAPNGIPEAVYRNAVDSVRPGLQASYAAYFADNQLAAMIFPATADAAPSATPDNPMEIVIDGERVSIFINDHNSGPGALAGQPGVVMPVAMNSAGMPLAASLDGRRGQDRLLLAVTRAVSELVESLPAPAMPDHEFVGRNRS